MFAAGIVVFREVLEAALIISIVMAATRGAPRRGLFVVAGAGAGILGDHRIGRALPADDSWLAVAVGRRDDHVDETKDTRMR